MLILICLHFTVRPELVEGLTELPNLKNRHSGMDCWNTDTRDGLKNPFVVSLSNHEHNCVANATVILMWALVPTDEILFFARTKKNIQKKRPPDAACFLRFSYLQGGLPEGTSLSLRQRAASMPHP
ncbi:hypothetical protein [Methyloglobulus sp.]|uniref:hypothetical protein n=1 Tax=Methyloglobulus sp. TaxID=2518622 RepID=UPI0032B84C5E